MRDNSKLKASNKEKKMFFYGVIIGVILGFLLVIVLIGFIESKI